MFSYWSKDDEENTESDSEGDGEKDKSAKPERFAYLGNDRKDWFLRNQSPNPLTGTNVYQNNYNTNVFQDRKKKMNDMLQDVWSVRKDVRVNTNAVKASEIGAKSFYSRHGGVQGATGQSNIQNEKNRSGDVSGKTWSVQRPTFSYSDNLPSNQYDILDETNISSATTSHNDDVQKQNVVNSLRQGMITGPTRPLTARTKKAEKLNNAYLRSTGLGKYTPAIRKTKD